MKILFNTTKLCFNSLTISEEVETIMQNYSSVTQKNKEDLQIFFNKIGNIKSKLIYMTLPMFASTVQEALFDIVTKTVVHSGDPASAYNDQYFTLNDNQLVCNTSGWSKSYFLYRLFRDSTWKYYQPTWATTFKDGSFKSICFNENINNKLSTNYGGFLSDENVINFRATRHYLSGSNVYGKIYGDKQSSEFAIDVKTSESPVSDSMELYGNTGSSSGGFTSCLIGIDITEEEMITIRQALITLHTSTFIG